MKSVLIKIGHHNIQVNLYLNQLMYEYILGKHKNKIKLYKKFFQSIAYIFKGFHKKINFIIFWKDLFQRLDQKFHLRAKEITSKDKIQ